MRLGTLQTGPCRDGRKHQSWVSPATGVTVHYEARAPKYDCDTLVVIFSSIRGKNSWLDFEGINGHALSTNRARLLFIYDDFSDEYTYYVMKSGTSTIGITVEEFLKDYIEDHHYTTDRVIFSGLSKGASAAILHGTRFARSPIVALAPQLSLGSYLSGRTDLIFENIIGPRTQSNIEFLDKLVTNAITHDVDHTRPLYVLTSTADSNCYRAVTGTDSILSFYDNASLILTSSRRAIEHASTLHYLMPTFLSLLGLMSSGLRPSLGRAGPKPTGQQESTSQT